MGAVLRESRTGILVGLTNWHVAVWRGIRRGNRLGSDVRQGHGEDIVVGWLHAYSKELDCALLRINVDVDLDRGLLGSRGRIVEVRVAVPGDRVFKVGATTGRTEGIVASASRSRMTIRWPDSRVVDGLSDNGDSGSVWVAQRTDGDLAVLGLHWGGETGAAYAISFVEIARRFGLAPP